MGRKTQRENPAQERGGLAWGQVPYPVKINPVTEASTTTNQSIQLGEEGFPSRRLMTQSSERRQEAARPTPLLTPRTTTRVATWNIRTMYESGRTFQVAREMKNYKIGVLGLSGTRWIHTGQLRISSGEQLLYSGHTEVGAPHTEGVALMLAPEALDGNLSTLASLQPSSSPRSRTSSSTSSSVMLPQMMRKTKRKTTFTNS